MKRLNRLGFLNPKLEGDFYQTGKPMYEFFINLSDIMVKFMIFKDRVINEPPGVTDGVTDGVTEKVTEIKTQYKQFSPKLETFTQISQFLGEKHIFGRKR